MWPLSRILLLATLSGMAYAAIGPVATLPIANVAIAPDGFRRDSTLAGGVFPAPVIQATKGAGFSINVLNELTDNSMDLETSIHWHGLFQSTTNYADGGAFVNQCPIVPFKSFLYRFNGEEQTGTYWYHSHLKAQYCDGLRGALVIYDPRDPHARLYDVDNEQTIITLADWYHYVSHVAPLAPEANSTLNGKGRYPGGPSVPLAVVNVKKGLRYRLRLVSISCDPAYNFSIDGHQLTIIESDGINVQPLVVDSLEIFAGQRYSVVLNANQSIGNYWIRALPNVGIESYTGFANLAILRYLGALPQNPKNNPTVNIPKSVLPLKETDLHPLVPTPVPGKPFPGGAGNSTYNYVDPVIRDVVSIGDDGDNVTIRFFTDNPGPWFLHCHIDWHLEKGFAVVFAEDVLEVPTTDIVTAQWKNLCPVYNAFINSTLS